MPHENNCNRLFAAQAREPLCRYCLGCAVLGVEQTIINLLLRAMLDIVAEPGCRTSAQACISLCSSALAQGCELLAASFLSASVQTAHADTDFPELVQSELQRLLLSVKTRCYSLACGPLEEGTTFLTACATRLCTYTLYFVTQSRALAL